jgi:hypothetical protein
MSNFSDGLWNGLADAVADIRQKVVEEPMWGRSLGENDAPSWPQAQEPEPSFGSSTQSREIEPEREQAQDIDLDR